MRPLNRGLVVVVIVGFKEEIIEVSLKVEGFVDVSENLGVVVGFKEGIEGWVVGATSEGLDVVEDFNGVVESTTKIEGVVESIGGFDFFVVVSDGKIFEGFEVVDFAVVEVLTSGLVVDCELVVEVEGLVGIKLLDVVILTSSHGLHLISMSHLPSSRFKNS